MIGMLLFFLIYSFFLRKSIFLFPLLSSSRRQWQLCVVCRDHVIRWRRTSVVVQNSYVGFQRPEITKCVLKSKATVKNFDQCN